MIINQQNMSMLFTSYSAAFNQSFEAAKAMLAWSRIATRVPSTTKSNTYGWLDAFPNLRKWVGDRVVKNLAAHGYTILNDPYEATVGVPARDIEADQHGVFAPLMGQMGWAAASHPEILMFDLLKNGFAGKCYDGQFFFDTDHPEGDGVVSNMQAGVGDPWFLLDTRSPLKPLLYQVWKDHVLRNQDQEESEPKWRRNQYEYGVDADLGAGYGFWQMAFGSKADLTDANFDAALEAISSRKNDEGKSMGLYPTILVCGPSNRAKAKKVIEAEKLANSASNTNFKAVEVLVSPYLAA